MRLINEMSGSSKGVNSAMGLHEASKRVANILNGAPQSGNGLKRTLAVVDATKDQLDRIIH